MSRSPFVPCDHVTGFFCLSEFVTKKSPNVSPLTLLTFHLMNKELRTLFVFYNVFFYWFILVTSSVIYCQRVIIVEKEKGSLSHLKK